MKRFIGRISLLMAMLLFCASCAFAASYPCGGYATKNAVNVRKKASQSSDPVGKLKLNETVTVLGEAQNGKRSGTKSNLQRANRDMSEEI